MKISDSQAKKIKSAIQHYIKTYVQKQRDPLDESSTRLIINNFLTSILGYRELDEIKTEFAIKGTYADYLIQFDGRRRFLIEVKSMQLELSENHLRQAIGYAANLEIDWVLLTNARQFELYRVRVYKHIEHFKVFSINMESKDDYARAIQFAYMISKKGFQNKEPEKYWARYQSLHPENLAKILYDSEIIRHIRKQLKAKSGITFSEEDVIDSIYKIIVEKIPSQKPKIKKKETKPELIVASPTVQA